MTHEAPMTGVDSSQRVELTFLSRACLGAQCPPAHIEQVNKLLQFHLVHWVLPGGRLLLLIDVDHIAFFLDEWLEVPGCCVCQRASDPDAHTKEKRDYEWERHCMLLVVIWYL